MHDDVSTARLYLLRAMYLIMAVGLGVMIGPLLFQPPAGVEHMRSVVRSVLAAVALLALLGLRYPLKMLPLLFFELIWKAIWMLVYGLPLWLAGPLDAAFAATIKDNLTAVLLIVAIPWGYAWRHYVNAPSDRWRNATPQRE